MKQQKADRRSQRTYRLVSSAFAELLVEKPWLTLTLNEPACFDKEGAALIDCYRYVLVLLCDKEHVVDGLSGHHLALFTSS